MRVDQNHVDVVCQECGRIHETLYAYSFDPEAEYKKPWAEYVKKQPLPWDFPTSIKADGHAPKVKQSLRLAKTDQRVETILLSPENTDAITDSFRDFRQPRLSKLLALYNKDDLVNYDPITRGKLRESYEQRFKERKDAKIDKWIEKILAEVLKPLAKKKKKRAVVDPGPGRRIPEAYFPGHFIYIGTERTRPRRACTVEENERIFLKGLTYHRAKQVQKSLPVKVTRTYEGAGGETKGITFVLLRDGNIDVTGDEIGDRFKGFFLSEAKKRKLVTDELEERAFLFCFERSNCFGSVRYFDHPSDYPPH